MASLHKTFNDSRTHKNTRLFLARLIVNRAKVFQPYARFWLGPLAQLVVGGDSGGVGLHYFVVDIVVTILSWSTVAVLEVGRSFIRYLLLFFIVVVLCLLPSPSLSLFSSGCVPC